MVVPTNQETYAIFQAARTRTQPPPQTEPRHKVGAGSIAASFQILSKDQSQTADLFNIFILRTYGSKIGKKSGAQEKLTASKASVFQYTQRAIPARSPLNSLKVLGAIASFYHFPAVHLPETTKWSVFSRGSISLPKLNLARWF